MPPLVLDGTNGVSGVDGTASNPAIEGTDSNTGIFYPAADTVAIGTGGTERLRVDSAGNAGLGVTPSAWNSGYKAFVAGGTNSNNQVGGIASGSGITIVSTNYYRSTTPSDLYAGTGYAMQYKQISGEHQWLTAASGTAGNAITFTQAMTLDASGNLGIGTTSQNERIRINSSTAGEARMSIAYNGTLITYFGSYSGIVGSGNADDTFLTSVGAKNLIFGTNSTERARITSGGEFIVGKTTTALGTAGSYLGGDGSAVFTRSAAEPVAINRTTNDGTLINFYQADISEGTISVSGNTVSYNPFLGSHAGAFADWSRPEVKIGTIFETINELIDYKVVVIEVPEEVPATEETEAITVNVPKRISYNGNGAIGTTATVEYEGQEYTGIIENERGQERDFNKHVKVKINDTPDSKAVYGVFVGWNTDPSNDGGVYNDMLIGAVGNYVIRMASGQTPEIGDLVKADGTGCAIVQEDDIVRTKTVGKITNTIPQLTYEDGSFLVACVLYCG